MCLNLSDASGSLHLSGWYCRASFLYACLISVGVDSGVTPKTSQGFIGGTVDRQ